MSLIRFACIGLLIDGHEAHKPHKAANALFVDLMTFAFQMPCHLTHAVKRRVHKRLVDERHELQIISALAFALIIKRGARQR